MRPMRPMRQARAGVRSSAGFAALLAILCATLPAARAGEVAQRVQERRLLQVCIWPAYQSISYRDPKTDKLVGLDIDLSVELAHDLGVSLRHVDSSFVRLVDDLQQDRCDLAMFAIGIRPERQAQLAFSRPYMRSDIYAVTLRNSRVVRDWSQLDRPGVRVAVQAGTFMQPVMAATLKQAELVVVAPPAQRERELEAGRIDVFMSDYPYSRRLLHRRTMRVIPPPRPFHVVNYGYALKQGDAEWLARIDRFVERIQRDGRLEAAAHRHGLSDIVVQP